MVVEPRLNLVALPLLFDAPDEYLIKLCLIGVDIVVDFLSCFKLDRVVCLTDFHFCSCRLILQVPAKSKGMATDALP